MTIPFPAHVLIADDHAIVREGLRAVLEREPDLTVVAEAGDGAAAVQAGLSSDVHLAILDIAMPRMTGLQAAREFSRRRSDLRILILSMYDKEQYFLEALTVGASGYVLKRAADRDIVEACRTALRGEPFIYPTALRTLMRRYLEAVERGETPGRGPLTPREAEIVKLIAEGRGSQEIADVLVISPKTVERHRANILEKLGMHDRVDLTRYAIREGLIEP
ncbi:MAG TPA: response regulator transcription factor [Solirubrobacteraceae bacterium]|nr:response regulator transcription factor [Solirubrobacteraceae bacterium]